MLMEVILFKTFLIVVIFIAVSCNQDQVRDDLLAFPDQIVDEDMVDEVVDEVEDEVVVKEEDSEVDGDVIAEVDVPDADVAVDEDLTVDEDITEDDDVAVDEDLIEEESTVDGEVPDKSVFLEGNNDCYMIQAYFPKESLLEFLPEDLSLPQDVDMKKYYPDTVLKEGELPFLASFCHGSEIHDNLTNQSVPEQEELMFLFPVIYTHSDGVKYLCSYSPVLYLNSRLGVTGGLYYGLRKEYHSEMEYGEPDDHSKWWSIEDILDVSFEQYGEDLNEPPKFFEQILAAPFVTMSYPQPLVTMVFYQSKVYVDKVRNTNASLWWNYNDSDIYDGEDTVSIYSKYFFTMSKPMNRNKFYDN